MTTPRAYYAERRARIAPALLDALRTRLDEVMDGGPAWGAPAELVGCSGEELLAHLAAQLPADIEVGSYGKTCVIDHVKPLATWTFEQLCTAEGQREAMHFTNLRPVPPARIRQNRGVSIARPLCASARRPRPAVPPGA